MVSGVDPFEKLKHQVLFLHERDLTSYEMEDLNRQLWLLERLAGGDRQKLDSHLLDRLNRELGEATMRQLEATELLYDWLAAWEARDATMSSAEREPAILDQPLTFRHVG